MNTKDNMKVKVEKLDNFGNGIAHIDNKVCFIKSALPDELAEINIKEEKKKYINAEIKEILTPSKSRIKSECPYSKACGGCSLGHIKYEEALLYKKEKVTNILKRNLNCKINPQVIASNKQYYYRNKITLKINNYKWGYYNSESHDFVPIKKCLLAKKSINDIIENQEIFKIKNGEIVLRTNDKNEILISIKTSDNYNINYDLLQENVVGIVVNNKVIKGNNYFYHNINNRTYKISYDSFFQINDYICSQIFDILNSQNLGSNVLDLYCGVGSLGLAISDSVKKIYGIELIENAVKDAKLNAENNDINNAIYLVGEVEKNLQKIKEHIDTIILDPPRKGLANIDEIMDINADNIIYISCDPVTLGRDLEKICLKYTINEIYVLDMFPETYHVETICIMKRK